MANKNDIALQNATPNNLSVGVDRMKHISEWVRLYFETEVTTSERSQKEQRRDLQLFLAFMIREVEHDYHSLWVPRLSQSFKVALQKKLKEDGSRYWSDATINRILAHLKTFAKWVHGLKPFPLGDPTRKIKSLSTGNRLEIERALTRAERHRLLNMADMLVQMGGRSRDRHRYRQVEDRPQRKGYRGLRNRAIIYTLVETGMRRTAVTKINLADVDFDKGIVPAEEKGGSIHRYKISSEGLQAIRDYLARERPQDFDYFQSAALFLPANTVRNSDGRLKPRQINDIWNPVCEAAGVEKGKTPHAARHAMGKHIMEKTGNVAAVQRQLGHKNAAYSMQYARITDAELQKALDERE